MLLEEAKQRSDYKFTLNGIENCIDGIRHNWMEDMLDLEDCGYAVEHSSDKRAYLYAHPHQISGVIKKNDVKNVHPDGICMFVLMKYSAYSPNVSVYQDLVLSLTPSTIQIRRVNTYPR